MRKVASVSPGEMLDEELLKPLGMIKNRPAKEIGVPPQRTGDIVSGKRGITADTDLRFRRFFSLSEGWWLRLRAKCDTEMVKDVLAGVLCNIHPPEQAAV
ncbi:MAG: HigA family addiction module antitoxin [Sideroxydans sp.]|jgi:addiction module HigA family antidote